MTYQQLDQIMSGMNRKYIYGIFVLVAGLLCSGCGKETTPDVSEGVRFMATTGGMETRTIYGTVSGTKQYVDWVAGDQMTVLMFNPDNTVESSTKAYQVSSSERDGDVDEATVTPVTSGDDLRWNSVSGTNTTFYAMYPTGTLTTSSMSGTIPSDQTSHLTWSGTTGTHNMVYAYMFAKNTVTTKASEVKLVFNPEFSAFEFTVTNPGASAINLDSFTLKNIGEGGSATAVCGNFTLTPSTLAVNPPVASSSNQTVTVSFTGLSGGHLTVPAAGSATFTLFTLPVELTDMVISMDFNVGGSTVTRNLNLRKNNSFIVFPACQKHVVSGISLPSVLSGTGTDITWNTEYYFEVINPTDFTAAAGTSSTAHVVSYSYTGGTGTPTAVGWTVEGYYETEAAALAGGTGISKPSWLTTTISSNSTADQTLSIEHGAISSTGSDLATQINNAIAANTSAGGSSVATAVNLAHTGGKYTDNYITESANCYIVNGPGYYKIPLVMGNGVINDEPNTASTYQGSTNTGCQRFKNYKNTNISNPYLVNNLPSGKTIRTTNPAVVLWEDESNLVSVDNVNNGWLFFHLNSTTIKQGNAVIAIYDSDNLIMWSYHIWVTDFVPQSRYLKINSNNLLPYTLGWVTTAGDYEKEGGSVYVRMKQLTTDAVKVLSLVAPPSSSETRTATGGRNPFYQWGRKDPLMLRSVVSGFSNRTSSTSGFSNSYYLSIQYPMQLFCYLPDQVQIWWGGSSAVYNVWNADDYNGHLSTTNTTKTIYDPCPAGYKVPHIDAYVTSPNESDMTKINDSYITVGWLYHSVEGNLSGTNALYTWASRNAQYSGKTINNYNNANSTYSYFQSGSSNIHNAMPIIPIVD